MSLVVRIMSFQFLSTTRNSLNSLGSCLVERERRGEVGRERGQRENRGRTVLIHSLNSLGSCLVERERRERWGEREVRGRTEGEQFLSTTRNSLNSLGSCLVGRERRERWGERGQREKREGDRAPTIHPVPLTRHPLLDSVGEERQLSVPLICRLLYKILHTCTFGHLPTLTSECRLQRRCCPDTSSSSDTSSTPLQCRRRVTAVCPTNL